MMPSIQKYADFRHQIRSGDILLCSGTAAFSKLIQHATGSIWSHVGVLMRLDEIDRIVVLESVEDVGVRAVPLSHYVSNYDSKGTQYPGKLVIARHRSVNPDLIPKFAQTGVDLLGYPYDKEEIAKIAYRLIMQVSPNKSAEKVECGTSFICSEYAFECFKSFGIAIQHSGDFVTPNDFAVDPAVSLLCQLL